MSRSPRPSPRPPVGVVAVLLAAILAGLLIATTSSAATTTPAARRVAAASSGPDPQLRRLDCALMGRRSVAGGCSRTRCRVPGETIRRSPNAETCLVGGRAGAAYGTEIDVRTCASLHRRWVAPVNFCASNPHRDIRIVERARQCVPPFTTYVVTSDTTGGRATRREIEGSYDVCVRPQVARRLERQAKRTGVGLGRLAVEATAAQQQLLPGPRVLMVGDSLTRRGSDELARLRPDWLLDGASGRNLRDLGSRLRRFETEHGTPTGLVIALGTNPARGYDETDLLTLVDQLSPATPVMVVTPYRRPRLNLPAQVRKVDRAAEQLRQLAATRPATCVADWRGVARADPDVLVDGTHQTRPEERRWARLVSRSWGSCAPR